MNLNIGDLAYVDYGEGPPQVVHCRLILDVVDAPGSEFIIGTPDFDVYSEVLDPGVNGDITRVWQGRANGALPAGLRGDRVYGFAPMTMQQLTRLMDQGRAEGQLVRAARGLAAEPAAAGIGGVRAGVAAPAPGAGGMGVGPAGPAPVQFWVLGEMVVCRKIGERVVPGPELVTLGDYGLCNITGTDNVERPCLVRRLTDDAVAAFCDDRILLARSAESSDGVEKSVAEDVRTLEVRYASNGERQRNFRESVRELSQTEFDDWPLEPRTALDYVRAVSGIAESATAQHHIWINSAGIPPGDRSVYEDQLLARVLDTALCYDSLNIANLACMELVCRRRQLLADAHSGSPGAPSYLGAEHYLGETYKMGGGIVVPSLTDHVSKKMQAQSQIMKEKRKLSEATSLGKGGKKGQPVPVQPKNPPPAKAGGVLRESFCAGGGLAVWPSLFLALFRHCEDEKSMEQPDFS